MTTPTSGTAHSARLPYRLCSIVTGHCAFELCRTLSGAVKWVLQSQALSDAVAYHRGDGAQKGVISWRGFLRVAGPHLAEADAALLATDEADEIDYDTPLPDLFDLPGPRSGVAEAKPAARQASAATGGRSDKAGVNDRNRSRSGFKDSAPSDEDSGSAGEADTASDSDGGDDDWRGDRGRKAGDRRQCKAGTATAAPKSQSTNAPGALSTSRHWSAKRTPVERDEEVAVAVADVSDVDELDLSTGKDARVTPGKGSSWSAASKGAASLNRNVKARRQWDDDAVEELQSGSDGEQTADISITSGPGRRGPAAVGDRGNTRWGGPLALSAVGIRGQDGAGASRGSVFDSDLLDDSAGSIPMLGDPSTSREGSQGSGSDTEEEEEEKGKGSGGGDSGVSQASAQPSQQGVQQEKRQGEGPGSRYLHNSFDDDDDDDDDGGNDQSHVSAANEARAPAAQALHPTGTIGDVSAGHYPMRGATEGPPSSGTALTNSFDDGDDEDQAEEKSGREPYRRDQQQEQEPSPNPWDVDDQEESRLTLTSLAGSEAGSVQGGEEDSTAPKKQKGSLKKAAKGAKKFIRGVFSLTSASSANSLASGSVASNTSPTRSRVGSVDSSQGPPSTTAGSVDGDDSLMSAAQEGAGEDSARSGTKSKSLFGRMKKRFSRGRADSRDSAASDQPPTPVTGTATSTASTAASVSPPLVSTTNNSPIAERPDRNDPRAAAAVPADETDRVRPPDKPPRPPSFSMAREAPLSFPPSAAEPSPTATSPAAAEESPARITRSDSAGSELSVASSVRTAGTDFSVDSAGNAKKKKGPTLKGMVHKSYKVMFNVKRPDKTSEQSPAEPSPVTPAQDSAELGTPQSTGSAGADVSSASPSHMHGAASPDDRGPSAEGPVPRAVGPPKPPRSPVNNSATSAGVALTVGQPPATAAGPATPGRPEPPRAVDVSPPSADGLKEGASPVKPPKRVTSPLATEATRAAHTEAPQPGMQPSGTAQSSCTDRGVSPDAANEGTALDDAHIQEQGRRLHQKSQHRQVPPPATTPIYRPLPASSLPASEPDPSRPSDAGPASVSVAPTGSNLPLTSASQPDAHVADSAAPAPATTPTAALRRSSFKLSSLLSLGGGGGSRNSSRASSRSSSRPHSRSGSFSADAPAAASPGPARSEASYEGALTPGTARRNGTGLAALLRGTARPPARDVPAREHLPRPAAGFSEVAELQQDYSPQHVEPSLAERCREVLERSRSHTAAVLARLEGAVQPAGRPGEETQHGPLSPTSLLRDMQRIREERRRRADELDATAEGYEGRAADARDLMQNWRSLLKRSEPLTLTLPAEERLALRLLAETSLKEAAQRRSGGEADRDSVARDAEQLHKALLLRQSCVPDPLFGLRVLQLKDRRVSRHWELSSPAGSAGAGSSHSAGVEAQRLAAENAFYSELDLALGVKFAGPLERVSRKFWSKRYFVLAVEPLINPNLRPAGDAPGGAVTPEEEQAAQQVHTPGIVAATPPSVGFYLLEYARSTPSKWGDVPVQLLKRYALRDMVALRTDSRPSKKGLEFSIVLLQEPKAPAAAAGQTKAEPPVEIPTGPPPPPVTLRSLAHDAKPGNRFASVVAKSVQKPAFRPLTPQQEAGPPSVISSVSAQSTGPHPIASGSYKHPSASDGAPVTAEESAGAIPEAAPGAEGQEADTGTQEGTEADEAEEPVVKTRWSRLLKFKKRKSATIAAPVAAPPAGVPSPAPASTAQQPAVLPPSARASDAGSAAGSVGVGGNTERGRANSIVPPGRDRSLSAVSASSAGRSGAGDNDVQGEGAGEEEERAGSDHDSELDEDEGEGDYYYRAGTFPGQQAGRQAGAAALKGMKGLRKLRFRAPTPGDRLQWVQILHAVAAPATYSNTTSY
jgi:hypothetical protein